MLLGIVLSLIFHDIQFGPQAALIAESFGGIVRYSGDGIGYHLAPVIAGGPAPLIATAILQHTGSTMWISLYMIGCAALAMVALLAMPRAGASTEPARRLTEPTRHPHPQSGGRHADRRTLPGKPHSCPHLR